MSKISRGSIAVYFFAASHQIFDPATSRERPMFRRASLVAFLVASRLVAQQAPLVGFDDYVTRTMKDWKDPGLAIAIVRNDSVVLMKGYGTRTLGKNEPVDEHTMFAIGSSSKAFTAMLVAMMVDAG